MSPAGARKQAGTPRVGPVSYPLSRWIAAQPPRPPHPPHPPVRCSRIARSAASQLAPLLPIAPARPVLLPHGPLLLPQARSSAAMTAHQTIRASPGLASPGLASPGLASPGLASPGRAIPGPGAQHSIRPALRAAPRRQGTSTRPPDVAQRLATPSSGLTAGATAEETVHRPDEALGAIHAASGPLVRTTSRSSHANRAATQAATEGGAATQDGHAEQPRRTATQGRPPRTEQGSLEARDTINWRLTSRFRRFDLRWNAGEWHVITPTD
jgi:DNA polymerase III subunit gamma/tau